MRLPEKALKLLRLALCDGVHEGEQTNASLSFIRELKKAGITAEMFMGPPVPKGFTRVKRDVGNSGAGGYSWPPYNTTEQCASESAATPSRPSPAPKNNPYGACEEEQLQWVYENRHRLSKKMSAAAIEEMSARGLI